MSQGSSNDGVGAALLGMAIALLALMILVFA